MKESSFNDEISESATGCPLLDPSVPPISDNEHLAHYCLCYLCTCNLHICPGSRTNLFPSSPGKLHRSLYRIDYRKHSCDVPESFKSPEFYSPKEVKMECVSTSQADYVAHKPIEVPSRFKQVKSAHSGQVFFARSTYQSQYPNWNVSTGPVKNGYSPYKTNEIRFNARSTYRNDFREHNGKFSSSSSKPTQESWRVITANRDWMGPTKLTEKKTKSHKQLVMPNKRKTEFVSSVAWTKQFATTYRSEYVGSSSLSKFKKKRLTGRAI